jgi:hypothetical protein
MDTRSRYQGAIEIGSRVWLMGFGSWKGIVVRIKEADQHSGRSVQVLTEDGGIFWLTEEFLRYPPHYIFEQREDPMEIEKWLAFAEAEVIRREAGRGRGTP